MPYHAPMQLYNRARQVATGNVMIYLITFYCLLFRLSTVKIKCTYRKVIGYIHYLSFRCSAPVRIRFSVPNAARFSAICLSRVSVASLAAFAIQRNNLYLKTIQSRSRVAWGGRFSDVPFQIQKGGSASRVPPVPVHDCPMHPPFPASCKAAQARRALPRSIGIGRRVP